mmetsp:Transcript_67599/g.195415  ORF Transcript_67599/g.195415 Transcript_67599/m.195415 type:complete len:443 (+) Transcript_67599:54-1382(+)
MAGISGYDAANMSSPPTPPRTRRGTAFTHSIRADLDSDELRSESRRHVRFVKAATLKKGRTRVGLSDDTRTEETEVVASFLSSERMHQECKAATMHAEGRDLSHKEGTSATGCSASGLSIAASASSSAPSRRSSQAASGSRAPSSINFVPAPRLLHGSAPSSGAGGAALGDGGGSGTELLDQVASSASRSSVAGRLDEKRRSTFGVSARALRGWRRPSQSSCGDDRSTEPCAVSEPPGAGGTPGLGDSSEALKSESIVTESVAGSSPSPMSSVASGAAPKLRRARASRRSCLSHARQARHVAAASAPDLADGDNAGAAGVAGRIAPELASEASAAIAGVAMSRLPRRIPSGSPSVSAIAFDLDAPEVLTSMKWRFGETSGVWLKRLDGNWPKETSDLLKIGSQLLAINDREVLAAAPDRIRTIFLEESAIGDEMVLKLLASG